MKEVPLYGKKAAGRVALVDDEDYDLVMQYRWNVQEQQGTGKPKYGPYALTRMYLGGGRRNPRYTGFRMHKLITGWAATDHRDGNGLNNCRYNLRDATNEQNSYNQAPVADHSSQYKGVSWKSANSKWVAQIAVNGRKQHLGLFTDELEAAEAYRAASLELHGEWSYYARAG